MPNCGALDTHAVSAAAAGLVRTPAGEIPGVFCILFESDGCYYAAKEPLAATCVKQLLGHVGLS